MGRRPNCPHCQEPTLAWQSPEQSTWGGGILYVCFNDLCPYYVQGWDWMYEHYRTSCSYRYSLDEKTGHAAPLPVWSSTALRESVVSTPNPEANDA